MPVTSRYNDLPRIHPGEVLDLFDVNRLIDILGDINHRLNTLEEEVKYLKSRVNVLEKNEIELL